MSQPTVALPDFSQSPPSAKFRVASVVKKAQSAVEVQLRTIIDTSVQRPKILVGCSGGADSLALTWITHSLQDKGDFDLGVIIIDHGLQSNSSHIAAETARQLRELGVDSILVKSVTVNRHSKLGLEAAARVARYRAFEETAQAEGSHAILLGHTQNDQAENVFLGLLRGSGAKSLAGMKPQRGIYHRPFLYALQRFETEAICQAADLNFWVDPSLNRRIKIRTEVIPYLERVLNHPLVPNLVNTARLLQEDDTALTELAQKLHAGYFADSKIAVEVIADVPAAVRKRLYLQILRSMGTSDLDFNSLHLQAIDRLITDWHGQKAVSVPGFSVHRHRGYLNFEPAH
jgi:tRNA(Ile)-lysidine synthase